MGGGEARLGALIAAMGRRRLDAYLCVRMTNVRYLTGFTGSDAALLVVGPGAILYTDGRYGTQAGEEVRGVEVVITDRKWASVARRLRATKARRIGYESRYLSMETYRSLARSREDRWTPVQDLVEPLRMRKDRGEILAIEAAAASAAAGLLSVLDRGVVGRTEREVAADLTRAMKVRGAEDASFRPIVADGSRSALPHAAPTDARIGPGGPLVVDFGARRAGYCSDETVTLLPSRPRRDLSRVFDAVRRAQEKGLSAIRPGVPCREVDARVRESLDRAGYLKYFVHSTGHGVGLDIHERPTLSRRSKDLLAEGMVVTVEPGVYLPGVGGVRLEDTAHVTARGWERITFLPKRLSPGF
ncbi:MAG TPA: aminopeptidase P family protein [Candidatus Deferrimicrobiaceae bacterium]